MRRDRQDLETLIEESTMFAPDPIFWPHEYGYPIGTHPGAKSGGVHKHFNKKKHGRNLRRKHRRNAK